MNTQNRRAEEVKVDNITPTAARYVKLVAMRPENDNAVCVYAFDVYSGGTTAISTPPAWTYGLHLSIIYSDGTLCIGNAADGKLDIYSINGTLVSQSDVTPYAEVPFHAAKGCYVARLSCNGRNISAKIVVR